MPNSRGCDDGLWPSRDFARASSCRLAWLGRNERNLRVMCPSFSKASPEGALSLFEQHYVSASGAWQVG